MKILVVGFFDDNYGDMLIRICFEQLLKTALHNLKITDYVIDEMPLKEINKEKVSSADIIMFPGGGLFGISYLDFTQYLEEITSIAEKNNIPVVFSSVGVNNMSYTDTDYDTMKRILQRKNIKYISVRENKDFFKNYVPKSKIKDIDLVCDPGVWTKYVYHLKKDNKKKCVGINVVRGGLFKANDKTWTMDDQFKYLNTIKEILDSKKLDYVFYTNGSFLDNHTLGIYKKECNIPDEKVRIVDTTEDFVNVMSRFDVAFCIRMHSSIVSYALDIPSINIVWNDKLRFFYDNIGYPNRAVELDDVNKELLESKLDELIKDKDYKADEKYLMSLYDYIYKVVSNITKSKEKSFNFKQVTEYLEKINVSREEDYKDLIFKVRKAEKKYLTSYDKDKEKNEIIRQRNEKIKELKQIPPSFFFRVKRKLKKMLKKK